MGYILYGISAAISFIAGYLVCKMIYKPEMNTDDCLAFLREKGYYINLNVLGKGDKR
jgi:hypothetical protein